MLFQITLRSLLISDCDYNPRSHHIKTSAIYYKTHFSFVKVKIPPFCLLQRPSSPSHRIFVICYPLLLIPIPIVMAPLYKHVTGVLLYYVPLPVHSDCDYNVGLASFPSLFPFKIHFSLHERVIPFYFISTTVY